MTNGTDGNRDIKLKAFESASDWSKQIVTIASATLVLSATFIKDIVSGNINHQGWLSLSWGFLMGSVVAGVFVLGTLSASLNKGEASLLDIYSGSITTAAVFQVLLFLAGMFCFAYFVHSNLPVLNVPPGTSQPRSAKSALPSQFAQMEDIYFDFGKRDIKDNARLALTQNAGILNAMLRKLPEIVVVVQGHCDGRGSSEYNFALGYQRAVAAKTLLLQLGVPANQLEVATQGKEQPRCHESTEACSQQNRRVLFTTGLKPSDPSLGAAGALQLP